MTVLLLLMLLVSFTSLVLQAAALLHLHRQVAHRPLEKMAARGYVRTASCRVLAACIYVTVALLDASDIQVPGAGTLGPESLFVLTAIQAIWLINTAMDIRTRHSLAKEAVR